MKLSALLLVAVLLSGCGSPDAASSQPVPWSTDQATHLRGFSTGCDGDACGAGSMELAQIPPQATATKVVVQVTIEGRTTGQDYASIGIGLDPDTHMDPTDDTYLRPGSYRVSLPQRSTTTLRWVHRNVPASDAGYSVSLGMTSSQTARLYRVTTHVSVTP